MSNFRAIATVTATLQHALTSAVQGDVAGATVTTVRPAVGANANLPATGVNLFLYQVAPNARWRNDDLPARRSDGEVARRPAAALDLNYLLTFYGSDLTLEPQRLLGSTAAFMHSQPLLTRAQILATVSDVTRPFLEHSDLADQVPLVRFAPLPLSLEDTSRLWSVLLQVPYTLSVAYQASTVLVERDEEPREAPPPREWNLVATPMRRPRIARIRAQAGDDAPIIAGSAVVIDGAALSAEVTVVEIDGVAVATDAVAEQAISLTLPVTLSAGPHTVLVRHGVDVGAAAVPHLAWSSNHAALVVQPTVTFTGGQPDFQVADVQGAGTSPRSATVTVGVAPPVGRRQTTVLELISGQDVVHTFLAQPRSQDTADLSFSIAGVAPGTYVVRVRVDGAESPVVRDAQGSPTGPVGTIP